MDAPGLQAAYVLHSRRYRDSSLILELLGRESGRVACVAKGALRARRADTRLQPFQPLLVELRGRGEMPTLVRAESTGQGTQLAGRELYCGLYLNELLLYLTPRQDPCPPLFDDYATAIGALPGPGDSEPVLRRFEVQLLDHLGFAMMLEQDSAGQPIEAHSRYTYEIDHGAVRSAAGRAGTLRGATLLALAAGRFESSELLSEARLLMRRVIEHRLDGRPLRSRDLFR